MAIVTEPSMGEKNVSGQIPGLVTRRWFSKRLVAWLEERADSREGLKGRGGHAEALRMLAAHVARLDPDRDRNLVILSEIEAGLRHGAHALGGEVDTGYHAGPEQRKWLSRTGDAFNPAPPSGEPMLWELAAAGARDLARAHQNANVAQAERTRAFEAEIETLRSERDAALAKLAEEAERDDTRDARIADLEARLAAAEELLEARGQARRERVEEGVYVNPKTGRYEALVGSKFRTVDSLEEARQVRDSLTKSNPGDKPDTEGVI